MITLVCSANYFTVYCTLFSSLFTWLMNWKSFFALKKKVDNIQFGAGLFAFPTNNRWCLRNWFKNYISFGTPRDNEITHFIFNITGQKV